MKSYLVVGILGIIMVAVCAMPHPPPDDSSPHADVFEWLMKRSDPERPIPSSRVERNIGQEVVEDEPAAYGLDIIRHPESDRKGGKAKGEAREFRFADGSLSWIDFIL